MKWLQLLLISSLVVLSASNIFAADKNRTQSLIDTAKATVEATVVKIEGNKEAAADLDRARAALKQADASFLAGKSMFGFGDINPEAEKEILLSIDTAELAATTALSRVEFARATTELESIEKQFVSVKAKLKLFEDRKAELERLRLEVAACQKTGKELETIKTEKATLTAQVEQLAVERSRGDKLKIEQLELSHKLDEMKAENARLSSLLEKQQELRTPPPQTVPSATTASPDDAKKKSQKKP